MMRRTTLTSILAGGLLLLASPLAGAVPIDSTEPTDFGNTNSSSEFLGTFDIGLNQVRGSVDRPAGDTFDFWHADLPAGLQITSIEISVTNSSGAAWRAIVEDRIISSFDELNHQAWLTTTGDGDFVLPITTGSLPFPVASYYFANVTFLSSSTAYDYTWQVEVAPVPEPGTAILTGLGLALLASRPRER